MDNLLVPLELIRRVGKRNIGALLNSAKAIPFISIYFGAIASQVLIAVLTSFTSNNPAFVITPKISHNEKEHFFRIILDNKVCYLLFLLNGVIMIKAWAVNPAIVPLIIIASTGYFLAPLIKTGKR